MPQFWVKETSKSIEGKAIESHKYPGHHYMIKEKVFTGKNSIVSKLFKPNQIFAGKFTKKQKICKEKDGDPNTYWKRK